MHILLSVENMDEKISKLVPVRQLVSAEQPMPGIWEQYHSGLGCIQWCRTDVMASGLMVTL